MLLKSGMPEYAHMPTDYVPDELLDAMVAAGVVVTPTLATNLREPPPMPEGPKPSPEMMKMLEQMKKYMEKMPSMEEKAATALDNTRRFIAKGGMVTMGTDTMRMETQPHVAVLPLDELQQLCLAGLGVKGAILAGTINSAKVCFAEQDYGTIEEGKLANLIVSRQFPDESFAALGDLCFAMNKGKALKNLL
jgi:imidazolonepropionase-like amidohydrolase